MNAARQARGDESTTQELPSRISPFREVQYVLCSRADCL